VKMRRTKMRRSMNHKAGRARRSRGNKGRDSYDGSVQPSPVWSVGHSTPAGTNQDHSIKAQLRCKVHKDTGDSESSSRRRPAATTICATAITSARGQFSRFALVHPHRQLQSSPGSKSTSKSKGVLFKGHSRTTNPLCALPTRGHHVYTTRDATRSPPVPPPVDYQRLRCLIPHKGG
jgi:hypothetical protein